MTTAGYTKKIQLSTDNATWKDLPAETAPLSISNGIQDNTDLSNNDGSVSRIYGLNDFSISPDGNFVPYGTYQFDVKKSGTSTAFTDEAMSLVSGNTFKIDDSVKEIFDRDATFTFEDNAVAIPEGDIDSIDYLAGTVTFTSSKSGPITVTGNYIPVTQALCVSSGSLDFSKSLVEDSNIKNIGANGWKSRNSTLKDLSISLTSFNDLQKVVANHIFNREVVLVEITLGFNDPQLIRGWFVVESNNWTGGVTDLEGEEISLQLDGDIKSSFTWIYTSSVFNEALKLITDNILTGGDLFINLLPANTIASGFNGPVELESFSVNFDLNAKTTFSSSFQGTGELVDATS